MLSKSDKVREELLGPTVRHAIENSAYYAAKFRDLPPTQTLDDLRTFPILDKATFVREQESISTRGGFPDYFMYTSGTSGEHVRVPVYESEIEAHRDLVLSQLPSTGEPTPLTLSLIRVGHGVQVVTRDCPTIPAHIQYGPEQVFDLLRHGYGYDGVSSRVQIVEGNLLSLRRLTEEALEKGIRPAEYNVPIISSTGWLITPRWWTNLEQAWGAMVLDRYGVTEVHGDAKYCPRCRWYHFDFTVIPEIVDPVTLAPVTDGVGALVLTGLYPFNQAQPKIRYWIDDFVSITPGPLPCGVDDPGYRFRGRINQTIHFFDGSAVHYLLFPTDVASVLDDYPEVARSQNTGFLRFRADASVGTRPIVCRLTVEVSYRPDLFARRLDQLRDEITARLGALNATFHQFVQSGAMEFRVVFEPPRTLKTIFKV